MLNFQILVFSKIYDTFNIIYGTYIITPLCVIVNYSTAVALFKHSTLLNRSQFPILVFSKAY